MRLVIFGAGGYGQTVADIAEQSKKYNEIIFLDDNASCAVDICNRYTDYINDDTEFYPAFGNNEYRLNWLDRLEKSDCKIATIIHSTAYCSPKSSIGIGTVVLPKAVINTDSKIGRGCIINLGAMIDHDCVLGEGVHVCLGAVIKGENIIPALTKIEAGEVIERAAFKGDK